jgi:transcriptional accessory protein Tex/SPT6
MKVHVAALSDDFVEDPFTVVQIGDEAGGCCLGGHWFY